MERSRTVSSIFILCHIVMYKCSVSCTESDTELSPDSIGFNHSCERNDKGKKLLKLINKLIGSDSVYEVNSAEDFGQTDFRNDSKELSGEYRVARDAHQVGNYFRNGGLETDHSHFFRDQNCDSSDKNNMVGESSPINKDNTGPTVDSSTVSTGSNVDYNPIVKSPNVPVPHVPESPYMPVLNSLLSVPRNLLYPVLNTLTGQPQSSGDSLLGAPLRQTFRNQIDKFRELPKHLLTAASSQFVNEPRTKPPKLKKRAKSKKQRKSNRKKPKKLRGQSKSSGKLSKSTLNTFLREPLGYIIRYMLHNERNQPVSPAVDSLQGGPSDTVLQSTNIEQYIASPAHSYHYIPRNKDVQQKIYCVVQ